MKNYSKVSILIAAYNRRQFLKECLESAKAQTYPNIEIVLVNDGSLIDLSEFAKDCEKYQEIPHSGISKARNKAMELATGDYYFILDSDDVVEPECIEKEMELMEKENADLVFCQLPIIGETGAKIGDFPVKVQTYKELLKDKYMPHPSSLFRVSSMDNIEYDENLRSAVDYDFLLKFMLVKKQKIAMLDEPLYKYREHHQGQETGTMRQKNTAKRIRNKYKDYEPIY